MAGRTGRHRSRSASVPNDTVDILVADRRVSGTKLVVDHTPVYGWKVTAYPDAGEAVLSFLNGRRKAERVEGCGDPQANRDRAERRARTMVRRFCAANGIDRLASLTFAPPFCTDPHELRCHMSRFFRRTRAALDRPFPYLWVPELHKDGERFHAHVGFADYIPKAQLAELWGHGFVDIRRIRVRGASSRTEHSRKAAGYLSKYVGKAFDRHDVFGRHRYECAQGFQPRTVEYLGATHDEAMAFATEQLGGSAPSYVWSSDEVDDWKGSPTKVGFWDK